MNTLRPRNGLFGLIVLQSSLGNDLRQHLPSNTQLGVILHSLPVLISENVEALTEAQQNGVTFFQQDTLLVELDRYFPFPVLVMTDVARWTELFDGAGTGVGSGTDEKKSDLHDLIIETDNELDPILGRDAIVLRRFPLDSQLTAIQIYFFWKTGRLFPSARTFGRFPLEVPYQKPKEEEEEKKFVHPWSGSPFIFDGSACK